MAIKNNSDLNDFSWIPTPSSPSKEPRLSFADAMAMLVSTPGLRSDNPVFSSAGVASTMGELRDAVNKVRMDKLKAREITGVWIDEAEAIDGKVDEMDSSMKNIITDRLLNELADKFSKAMFESDTVPVLSLTGPAPITVVTKDGFKTMPHIGGESFTPSGVRCGKKRTLIFTFKPAEAAAYREAELDLSRAEKNLSGFSDWLVETYPNFWTEFDEANRADREVMEAKIVEAKKDEYQEFGSW